MRRAVWVALLLTLVWTGIVAAQTSRINSQDEFNQVKKKAASGDAQAQYRLSVAYSEGKYVKQNDGTTVFWLRKSAEQGYTEAQFYLSAMYAKGVGVKADPAKSAEWMTRVAEKGFDVAQYNLGEMYENGFGVPRDLKQARAWYGKSAAQGNAAARQRLVAMRKAETARGGAPVSPAATGADQGKGAATTTQQRGTPGSLFNDPKGGLGSKTGR
jgi:TPR repeat protein